MSRKADKPNGKKLNGDTHPAIKRFYEVIEECMSFSTQKERDKSVVSSSRKKELTKRIETFLELYDSNDESEIYLERPSIP